MSFSFARFLVEDSRSTMKVGTDAMLLGSWVHPGNALSILDVGTGCGVLALMMAQVSDAYIDAIDLHRPSAQEAVYNISQSPWAGRIRVFCRSLEEHAILADQKYDIIISNPPFFTGSLKPVSEKKLLAKHEDTLTFEALLKSSVKLMHAGSSLCIILPVCEERKFAATALQQGLFKARTLVVRPVPLKPPHRILSEFRFHKTPEPDEDEMIIHSSENKFSEKYLAMTRNFHLFNQKTS